MNAPLTENAKALLLLTAPLLVGHSSAPRELLTPTEYHVLAKALHDARRQPADLLGAGRAELLASIRGALDAARLERLLGRGFLLGQAVEQWQARAIWVVCRADPGYPKRLRARLRDRSPPVLWGCGAPRLLELGGLAVVGSRNASPELIEETEAIGRTAATAGRSIVSGGARGIDQAAMRGALAAGGTVVGALADGLSRAAVAREHREALLDGRLALLSANDPNAPFHVGHAMQRNKLIYALADAALVMAAAKPSGTWSGAEEQLRKLRLVPLFTRSTGEPGAVLRELQALGAKPWPDPQTPQEWAALLPHAPSEAAPTAVDRVREPGLFDP